MFRPYSAEMRRHVIELVRSGTKVAQLAATFKSERSNGLQLAATGSHRPRGETRARAPTWHLSWRPEEAHPRAGDGACGLAQGERGLPRAGPSPKKALPGDRFPWVGDHADQRLLRPAAPLQPYAPPRTASTSALNSRVDRLPDEVTQQVGLREELVAHRRRRRHGGTGHRVYLSLRVLPGLEERMTPMASLSRSTRPCGPLPPTAPLATQRQLRRRRTSAIRGRSRYAAVPERLTQSFASGPPDGGVHPQRRRNASRTRPSTVT